MTRTKGRLLSTDPHIQQAANPQSFNRYSYVLNNPLFIHRPGFFKEALNKSIQGLTCKASKHVAIVLGDRSGRLHCLHSILGAIPIDEVCVPLRAECH